MFNLNDTMRYFLCPGRTDMRKGISSLCGVVHEKMNSEVKRKNLYLIEVIELQVKVIGILEVFLI